MTYRYRRLGLPRDALESGSGIQVDTRRSTIQDPRGGPEQGKEASGVSVYRVLRRKPRRGCNIQWKPTVLVLAPFGVRMLVWM